MLYCVLFFVAVLFLIFDTDDDGYLSAHDMFQVMDWQLDVFFPEDFAMVSQVDPIFNISPYFSLAIINFVFYI
jgi:hypothetical protein